MKGRVEWRRGLSATAVLGVTLSASACAGTPVDQARASQETWIDVAGVRLAATELGDGPAALVLHGGPSLGHRYLVPGLSGLAEAYRLVLFDQRGSGRSGGDLDFGVRRLVSDIDAVARATTSEPFLLIGHSWGAYLALTYARDHPERIQALILISPTDAGSRFSDVLQVRLRRRTTPADSAALAAAFGSLAFRDGSVAGMNGVFRAMYRPWFADRLDADYLNAGLTRPEGERGRAMGAMVSDSDGGITWAEIAGIRAPTLIVHGSDDIVPLALAEELSREIPEARLEVLDGVGHFPMLEAPERLNRSVLLFLDSLRIRGSGLAS